MSKQPKVYAERHLDIVDMPTDPFNVTGTLRRALVKQVNYCRNYPAKMEKLQEILEYTLDRMKQITEADAAEQKAKQDKRTEQVEAVKNAEKGTAETATEAKKSTTPAKATPAKQPTTKPTKPTPVGGAKVANQPVKG